MDMQAKPAIHPAAPHPAAPHPLAPRPPARSRPSPVACVRGDDGLSQRLTLLLNRVVAVLVEASSEHYRSLGLSIPAARAVIGLYEGGGEMTVGALAETASIELSTMSHILRRLERQDLVTRTRHKDDNRLVYAALTQAGRAVAHQCRESSLRHESLLLGDIPAGEAELLKRLLTRLYTNAKAGFRD